MVRRALEQALDSPAAKGPYVRRLFGTIAQRYDFITRFLSFGADQRWKTTLLERAGLREGWRVLDLACGTGDIALAARQRGATVVGLDVVPLMIALARQKPRASEVGWLVGDMVDLPVATASVDLVTTGYGLRNVHDLGAAIREIHRVLVPRGVLASLDFDRPESPALRWIYLAYLSVVGSALGFILHGNPDTYRYIPASIRRYPGARRVAVMLRDAGFADVQHLPVLGGLMAIHVARKVRE